MLLQSVHNRLKEKCCVDLWYVCGGFSVTHLMAVSTVWNVFLFDAHLRGAGSGRASGNGNDTYSVAITS